MLVLQKLKFREELLVVLMNEAEIWVQIHQLPFEFMCENVSILIGNHIGKFIAYDEQDNFGTWRKYMRIRVAINIQEPLKKSWSFDRLEGEHVHVFFKYEKLGIFCFLCGTIGHTNNLCHKKVSASSCEDMRGWGNFVHAEVEGYGGNKNTNRWLRGGRNQEGGGRGTGGSRSNDYADEINGSNVTDGQTFKAKGLNFENVKEVIEEHLVLNVCFFSFKFDEMKESQCKGTKSWIPFSQTLTIIGKSNDVAIQQRENGNGNNSSVNTNFELVTPVDSELASLLTKQVVFSERGPASQFNVAMDLAKHAIAQLSFNAAEKPT
ncbi:unnamed protein product [Lathyrus sativus]|nr:unnamed protein product [Lathyrus sativus]